MHPLTWPDLLAAVGRFITEGSRRTIAYANVHVINTAVRDAQLRSFLNTIDVCYCDGNGVVLGAKLLVDGGVTVAESLGVSKAIIGLTLVAIGTSLPELAIVIVASMRGHSDVALGNVLGSNIFNLLGITGAVALVAPLPVPDILLSFDIWVLLGVTVLLMPLMLTKGGLSRAEGGLLLLLYVAYLAFQFDSVRSMIG